MRLVKYILVLVGLGHLDFVIGMNWAQSSGNRTQPVVVPYRNAWTSRWGHAMVGAESEGFLYLFGGDDYRGHEDGGGQFHNDIWQSQGASWNVFEKVLTKESKVYSQLKWKRLWPDKLPPTGVDYEEWIECFTRKWRGSPTCTAENDPYNGDLRRWSPRRSHGAIYFQKDPTSLENLWVIGGRAADQSGFDHEIKLKNDVWASSDGISWRLVNPGCRYEDVQSIPGLGAEHSQCSSDIDCYGDSRCINIMTNQPASVDRTNVWNRCRCQIFRPRERFGLAVFEKKLYISGGIVNIKVTDCGAYPCNGGYESVASDVWTTSDGEIWTQLLEMEHKYSDHGLIESGGLLYIVSKNQEPVDIYQTTKSVQEHDNESRGVFLKGLPFPRTSEQHAVVDGPEKNEQFIYVESSDKISKYVSGYGWLPITDDTNNNDYLYVWPDAPVIRVQGGITEEDVAMLHELNIHTIRDLTEIDAQTVVDLRAGGLTYICVYMKRAEAIVNKCHNHVNYPDGWANFTTNVQVRAPMTHPFPHLRGSVPELSEEELAMLEAKEEHFIYGHDGCQQAELVEEQFAHLDDIPALQAMADRGYLPDVTCRWGFPDRTNIGAINFKGKLYIMGGRITNRPEHLVLEEQGDTWYRDDTVPVTLIPTKPETETSDTVFEFQCDEEGCLFDYMIQMMEDEGETVVDTLFEWTRTTGIGLDVLELLPGGGRYRIMVRAIDPAGNIDHKIEEGRNQYTWIFVPKIPIGLILGIIFGIFLVAIAVYLELRRRKKKAALERYALKRMRRKFKGMAKKNAKTKNKKGGKKKGKGKKDKDDGSDGKKKKKKKKGKKKGK